jgi:hypothetical protein
MPGETTTTISDAKNVVGYLMWTCRWMRRLIVERRRRLVLRFRLTGLSFVEYAKIAGKADFVGGYFMPKVVITLDEPQVTKLEQVVIDRDEKGAWELLDEIRARVRATQDTRCGIEKLRKGTP